MIWQSGDAVKRGPKNERAKKQKAPADGPGLSQTSQS